MKGANQRQCNERLNRALQSFLYGCLGAEGEAGAKAALAVLTELWRRQVWRDARTVNVIGALPHMQWCDSWESKGIFYSHACWHLQLCASGWLFIWCKIVKNLPAAPV